MVSSTRVIASPPHPQLSRAQGTLEQHCARHHVRSEAFSKFQLTNQGQTNTTRMVSKKTNISGNLNFCFSNKMIHENWGHVLNHPPSPTLIQPIRLTMCLMCTLKRGSIWSGMTHDAFSTTISHCLPRNFWKDHWTYDIQNGKIEVDMAFPLVKHYHLICKLQELRS